MNNIKSFNSVEHAVRVLKKSGEVERINGVSYLIKSKYEIIRYRADYLPQKAVKFLDDSDSFNPIIEISPNHWGWGIHSK